MTQALSFGRLVIGGFTGASLPASYQRALSQGRRGGAILFKSNVEGGPQQVAQLVHAIRAAADQAPIVGVDQEGGRVARLGPPALELPSARTIASWGDASFAERIAYALGSELAALGFTVNFAPVLDVNTCAENPVIGDRSFGEDADACVRFGLAYIRGLQRAGLLACGKHFPGHGSTSKDSHFDLPLVDRPREELERIDFAPFRAAAAAGVASMMTAHVVYTALDPDLPATLSRTVCSDLRAQIGFDGPLFSDDLEMQAIRARWSIEEASVRAIAAGCDALLICTREEEQERAVDALAREAGASPSFRARCEQAAARLQEAERRARARPPYATDVEAIVGGPASRAIAAEIAQRLGR